MANHKSAEKRARQTVKRNELNRTRRSAIRTIVKQAETTAASGNADEAKNSTTRRGIRIGAWRCARYAALENGGAQKRRVLPSVPRLLKKHNKFFTL